VDTDRPVLTSHGGLAGDDALAHDEHAHDHGPDHHEHGHDHQDATGVLARLRELLAPHSHDLADKVDPALEASGSRATRALVVSLVGLLVTAALQGAVVSVSGSVALLGDALHNVADAFTALPLFLAFSLGRRAPTSRFTYGFGRAEDLAGVVIVVLIAASSAAAATAAVLRLLHPADVDRVPLVAVAAVIGFAGNELVAQYRIRVGKEIGSAALVADGLHARTDGLTSLAVLVGAILVAAGWQRADPAIGIAITVAILVTLREAAREVYRRLMDAVDPELVTLAADALAATPGVVGVGEVRMRWIGHQLRAECEVVVAPALTVVEGHSVAQDAQHRLLHEVPRLTTAIIHVDPAAGEDEDHHLLTAHHDTAARGVGPSRREERRGG
jgi:cation diffusion facilitator family transporter